MGALLPSRQFSGLLRALGSPAPRMSHALPERTPPSKPHTRVSEPTATTDTHPEFPGTSQVHMQSL